MSSRCTSRPNKMKSFLVLLAVTVGPTAAWVYTENTDASVSIVVNTFTKYQTMIGGGCSGAFGIACQQFGSVGLSPANQDLVRLCSTRILVDYRSCAMALDPPPSTNPVTWSLFCEGLAHRPQPDHSIIPGTEMIHVNSSSLRPRCNTTPTSSSMRMRGRRQGL